MPNEQKDAVKEARELLSGISQPPWTADEMPAMSGGVHEWFEINDATDTQVAEVTNDYGLNFRNNAALIARAPELLKTLSDEVERLHEIEERYNEAVSSGLILDEDHHG